MAKKSEIAICDILDSDIEIEVVFSNPYSPDTKFSGTLYEVLREVDKRMLVYGTCEYRIVSKPSILFDMSEWEGDNDDDL